MTQNELIEYFTDKKIKGVSFRELAGIFEKNKIDNDTRKIIMKELDEIDKQQRVIMTDAANTKKRKGGFINLLIGTLIVIFGLIFFVATASKGVIFIFNIIAWGFGGLLMLRGVLHIIAGTIKKK